MLAMNISFLNRKSVTEIALDLAANVRARRKERKLTQVGLAKASGVSLGSLKRFENSGEIALMSLLRIAVVLESEDEFLSLFTGKYYRSIEDVINERG